jgi:hypothetical protein
MIFNLIEISLKGIDNFIEVGSDHDAPKCNWYDYVGLIGLPLHGIENTFNAIAVL